MHIKSLGKFSIQFTPSNENCTDCLASDRFVLPALPIAFLYCGYALSWLSKRKKKFLRLPFKILMSLLFVPNLIAIVYFSRFHQLAPVEIALFLGNYGSSAFSSQFPLTSVHFWTGCHSTPYYSHIHRAISLRLFECEPRFSKDGTVSNEESESVLFLNHPVDFLEALYREFQQQPENSVGENCKNFNNKQDCLGHAGSICQWVNVTILGDLETFCMPIWMSFNQIAHATYLTDDRLRSISAIQREWADPFMSQKRFFSESYYPLSFEGEEISWRNSFWDKVTSSSELPSHIVIFEEHLASVHPILIRYGFSRIRSFLYSWFDLDSRYMYLYARGK